MDPMEATDPPEAVDPVDAVDAVDAVDEPARRPDRLFRVALVLKGLDGAAELVAAVVLAAVPGATIHRLVADVLARDLLGSAHGALARHVATVTDAFAAGDRTFAVVYLGLHGVVKLALVGALAARWLPAYPVSAAVLTAFVVYEVWRAVITGSLLLPVLAVLDVAIVVMVVREYRRLRCEPDHRDHRPRG